MHIKPETNQAAGSDAKTRPANRLSKADALAEKPVAMEESLSGKTKQPEIRLHGYEAVDVDAPYPGTVQGPFSKPCGI